MLYSYFQYVTVMLTRLNRNKNIAENAIEDFFCPLAIIFYNANSSHHPHITSACYPSQGSFHTYGLSFLLLDLKNYSQCTLCLILYVEFLETARVIISPLTSLMSKESLAVIQYDFFLEHRKKLTRDKSHLYSRISVVDDSIYNGIHLFCEFGWVWGQLFCWRPSSPFLGLLSILTPAAVFVHTSPALALLQPYLLLNFLQVAIFYSLTGTKKKSSDSSPGKSSFKTPLLFLCLPFS